MARVAGNGLAPVTEGKERERMIIGRLTPPSRHSAAILDQHEPIRPRIRRLSLRRTIPLNEASHGV